MSKPLTRAHIQSILERLQASITRAECGSFDCMQGLLTQLELDAVEDV